ncbi:RNA polymerase sigma factor [Streptomyces roseoverticillatus]|uniref:RNA polymerase sigma factor n=1 Tax=Streptomyces roseoverticillatus TaxID=66429 RepID=UPI000ACD9DF1|nr:sigma-70 family RNA polymerase sigma factor [Streptomyces roseoverticillatus]
MAPGEDEYRRFFMRWMPQVLAYLTWLQGDAAVIEDAAQETLINAFRYWERVRTLEKPQAWLFKVAGQRLGDVEAARRRHGVSIAPQELPDRPPAGHRDEIAAHEENMMVVEAMRKLPRQQAIASTLHYVYGLKVSQIADIMEVAAGSVKTHLHRARRALQTVLGEDDEDEGETP